MSNVLSFQDKIVVFVDILGFGSLVEEAAKSPDGEVSKRLNAALKEIGELVSRSESSIEQSSKSDISGPFDNMDPHLQKFSDSFFLSLSPSRGAIESLFCELSRLYVVLMNEGIWIRGGIAFGAMSTADGSPCGPAINSAFKMESKISDWPRITFAKSFVNYSRELEESLLNTAFVERGEDGVYALAPLNVAINHPEKIDIDIQGCAENIRNYLNSSLEEIVDNPKHYNKITKLADQWNYLCDPNKSIFQENYRTKGYIDFAETYNLAKLETNDW